jgi:hypothetical protein
MGRSSRVAAISRAVQLTVDSLVNWKRKWGVVARHPHGGQIEYLEARMLLSMSDHTVQTLYTPDQIKQAYRLNSIAISGLSSAPNRWGGRISYISGHFFGLTIKGIRLF